MKFKYLFLTLAFSLFSFTALDIQAKPTKKSQTSSASAGKEFSLNRKKAAETACSQNSADACFFLLQYYTFREDSKNLSSSVSKLCKLTKAEICSNQSKFVSNAIAGFKDAKKRCNTGAVDYCGGIFGQAQEVMDLEITEIYAKQACKAGVKEVCSYDVKKVISAINNPQQALNEAKKQVQKINKECDSKNTLETCGMAFDANFQIGDRAGIKKYAAKVCKLGGQGKNLCKTEVSKACKDGNQQACEFQKLL